MWFGKYYLLVLLLMVTILNGTNLVADDHYYPDQQTSFQVYTQLYLNKLIFGFKVHAAVNGSLFLNTRFVFFNLKKVGVVTGLQLDRIGYDRKLLGFAGNKNRLFVDIYQ